MTFSASSFSKVVVEYRKRILPSVVVHVNTTQLEDEIVCLAAILTAREMATDQDVPKKLMNFQPGWQILQDG
jgi:hypothetical protein